jgi:HSP20 family protein
MDEATRLPVKTEKRAPVAAPAQWTPFESIRREIDRVFDRFHMGAWDFPFGRRAFEFEFPWPRVTGLAIAPAVDVVEKDKEYEITAELPGRDEKNIEIKLSNDTLTIKREKKEEKEEREKGLLCLRAPLWLVYAFIPSPRGGRHRKDRGDVL